MKRIFLLIVAVLLAAPVLAQTSPRLVADPWVPADAPDGVTYKSGTAPAASCALNPIVGGTQMSCDLSAFGNGVFPLVITVTKNPTCTNPIPGVEGNCTSYTPATATYKYTSEKKSVAPASNLRITGP